MLGAVLFFLAILSHDAGDFSVLEGGSSGVVGNWIGNIGAAVACNCFLWVGLASFVLAFIVLLAAIRSFLPQKLSRSWIFWPGVVLTVFGSAILLAFDPAAFAACCENLGLGRSQMPQHVLAGGAIGQVLVAPGTEAVAPGVLRLFLGPVGSTLLGATLLLAGLLMLYRADWHSVLVSAVDALCAAAPDREERKTVREKSGKAEDSFADRARKLLARSEKLSEEPPVAQEVALPEVEVHNVEPEVPVPDTAPAEDDLFAAAESAAREPAAPEPRKVPAAPGKNITEEAAPSP